MKYENVVKRINNFFSYDEDEGKEERIKYCIKLYEDTKKSTQKEKHPLSDTKLIQLCIESTLRHFGMWR